jgi:hypothetical protein
MNKLVCFAFCIILAGCCPMHHSDHPGQLRQLTEQSDITAVANKLFICTDNRDWACVKDVFAPQVFFDMTSLSGGKPEMKTPQQIADMWDQGLKRIKAIHHQAGNYRISVRGNEADMFCYGIAYHYLPNPTNQNTRTFVGSYDFHLVRADSGWKIDQFRFNLKFIDGNKDLEGAEKK